MPYIKYNPNIPGDRERAYGEYFIYLFLTIGAICSIYSYVSSLVAILKNNLSNDIFYSIGFLIIMAVIVFFVVFSKLTSEEKMDVAKVYFLFFFGGALDVASITAIIMSIISIINASTGVLLLICSIIVLLIVTLTVILVYRRIEGYPRIKVRLFTDKKVIADIQNNLSSQCNDISCIESNYIYCHKCGKALPFDSTYCNSCGAKIKE